MNSMTQTSRITFGFGYCFDTNQFRKYFPEFLIPIHLGLEIINPDFPFNQTNFEKLLGCQAPFEWILNVDDNQEKYYLGVQNNETSRIDFMNFISENSRLNKIKEKPIEFLL